MSQAQKESIPFMSLPGMATCPPWQPLALFTVLHSWIQENIILLLALGFFHTLISTPGKIFAVPVTTFIPFLDNLQLCFRPYIDI